MPEDNTPQLGPGKEHLNQFDYVSTRYDARIPLGVSIDSVLAPAFWAHHAVGLRPMDEIRARSEDGTWIATLIVLDCSRTWAKVQLLNHFKLSTADVSRTQAGEQTAQEYIEQHKVVWRANKWKWSVVRNTDGAIVKHSIGQRDEAVAWLDAHAHTVTAGTPDKLEAAEAATVT